MTESISWGPPDFCDAVARRSGTPVRACFQCHKCSTGCPTAEEMDLQPSQVMRMIHFGREQELLASRAIWLCASCEACTTRCPMGIDIAAVMDILRIMAIERQAAVPDARVSTFNDAFLRSVRRHGRVFEFGMLAAYKMRSGDLFSDMGKLPTMLMKGKLSLLPHRSAEAGRMKEIYRRAEEEDRKR